MVSLQLRGSHFFRVIILLYRESVYKFQRKYLVMLALFLIRETNKLLLC